MDSRLSAFYNKVLFGGKNLISDPKLIAFSMSKSLSEVCSLSLLLVWVNGGFRACRQVFLAQ